ncbi:MAG: alpha/beta fold hydrolase [Euryarchaeota archaeon]|nr:alpha/beta fold hydrolase [Euryarchaeota archaeon]
MRLASGYADVNGTKVFYEVAGEGRPLVFVHAGIVDRRMWDSQMRDFAKRYRVVRYDVRGYGKTAITPEPFAPHEDLRAVLEHLGIPRAAVVGASMGGKIALDFALAHPDRVDALVLVASALGGYEYTDAGSAALEEQMDRLIRANDFDKVVEFELQLWVAGRRRRLSDLNRELVARVREMLRPTYPGSLMTRFIPLDPPAIARLEEIQVPTLVVIGTLDLPDVQRIADILAARIPRAWKVAIEGTAHLPNMERPDEFNTVVLGFLERLEAAD